MQFSLRYDMRAPAIGASPAALYRTSLEQCAWADDLGFRAVYIGEHHGADDGYCPSPVVYGAAIAAVTARVRIRLSALVAVLHHPLRLAEDLAVLDVISAGRLELTLGIGYRPHEYEMFGVAKADRVALLREIIDTLKRAWTGEPFVFRGSTVTVRPVPAQRPGPLIATGSSVVAGARRAAHVGDGFDPPASAAALYRVYEEECRQVGRAPDPPSRRVDMAFLHVSDDPERDWPIVAPHVLHTVNSYAAWSSERGPGHPPRPIVSDLAELQAHPAYNVLTPGDCVTYLSALPADTEIVLQPLMGGLSPDIAWASLHRLEHEVIPHLGGRATTLDDASVHDYDSP